MGIYYLKTIKKASLGDGLFGYAKVFDGLGIYLNSVLNYPADGGGYYNYIQAYFNDNTEQINPMKLKNTSHCQVRFRNLEKGDGSDMDGGFFLQVEYKNSIINIVTVDSSGVARDCTSFQHTLDYAGAWLFTAGSGVNNPDQYEIIDFQLYDTQERVSQGHNEHFHEAHKRNSVRDMAKFMHEHHVKDLIHNSESFFNKEQFGEENILAMLPETLTTLKNLMDGVLTEFYSNINYFYSVTNPMHSHKNYNE